MLAVICGLVLSANLSIEDFGAVAGNETFALSNTNAIQKAFASAAPGDTLLVPGGKVFFILGTYITNVHGLTVVLDGTLRASPQFDVWPLDGGGGSYQDILKFEDCTNLTLTSTTIQTKDTPAIDGQGYPWWWREILQTLPHGRPDMLHLIRCQDVVIENIAVINSPSWNIYLDDVLNVVMRYVVVHVDVDLQKSLLRQHNRTSHISNFFSDFQFPDWLPDLLIDLDIPTFPLNTDGIDIKGRNVHIHDVHIVNYDDSIVPKPANANDKLATCTENILIENIVAEGVGMAIGSVPPSDAHNCVNNVTMRNVTMNNTVKGIYVKTDPGHSGTGIISNIQFIDFTIVRPKWWAVWIGPQQQHQPGWNWTQREECGLAYPYGDHCITQPLVPIENITLSNIMIIDPLLSPGVIRCNETSYDRPRSPSCRGLVFDRVVVSGNSTNFPFGRSYYCLNVGNSKAVDSNPVPPCFQSMDAELPLLAANSK